MGVSVIDLAGMKVKRRLTLAHGRVVANNANALKVKFIAVVFPHQSAYLHSH
jgi:hypothetical protein